MKHFLCQQGGRERERKHKAVREDEKKSLLPFHCIILLFTIKWIKLSTKLDKAIF
jgi:hypothetical protein